MNSTELDLIEKTDGSTNRTVTSIHCFRWRIRENRSSQDADGLSSVFHLSCPGVVTARDEGVYDFEKANVSGKARFFSNAYNGFLDSGDESFDPVIK